MPPSPLFFIMLLLIVLILLRGFKEQLLVFIMGNYWNLLIVILGVVLLLCLLNIVTIITEIEVAISMKKKRKQQLVLAKEFMDTYNTSIPSEKIHIVKKDVGVDINFFQRLYTVAQYCYACIGNFEIQFDKREDLLKCIEIWRKDGIDISPAKENSEIIS